MENTNASFPARPLDIFFSFDRMRCHVAVYGLFNVVVMCLACQLFKRFTFCFGNQEGREYTDEPAGQ